MFDVHGPATEVRSSNGGVQTEFVVLTKLNVRFGETWNVQFWFFCLRLSRRTVGNQGSSAVCGISRTQGKAALLTSRSLLSQLLPPRVGSRKDDSLSAVSSQPPRSIDSARDLAGFAQGEDAARAQLLWKPSLSNGAVAFVLGLSRYIDSTFSTTATATRLVKGLPRRRLSKLRRQTPHNAPNRSESASADADDLRR